MSEFAGVRISWKIKIVTVLIAFATLQAFVSGLIENRKFSKAGAVAVISSPVEILETKKIDKKWGREEISYSANLSFSTEDGKKIVVHKELSDELVRKFRRNQEVSIEYVKAQPEMVRWPGESRSIVLTFLAFVLSAGCAYFMFTDRGA